MNPDFVEMLSALSDAGADFLVVGAHALAAHGRPRATGDLDLWVRRTKENARKVYAALQRFARIIPGKCSRGESLCQQTFGSAGSRPGSG